MDILKKFLFVAHLALSLSNSAMGQEVNRNENLVISVVGEEKPVYTWVNRQCSAQYIPDAPARLFRRADGKIALIAAHQVNWQMVGDSFSNLREHCSPILTSDNARKRGYGYVWIEAVYTRDGNDIYALLSEDRTEITKNSGCPTSAIRGQCWLNRIISAKSSDMGQSYILGTQHNNIVASLGKTYSNQRVGRYGVFTTSNIVSSGKYLYSFMFSEDREHELKGNCLLQARAASVEDGWRAWDGNEFNILLTERQSDVSCKAVSPAILNQEVRSLSYYKKKSIWIATYSSRFKLKGDEKAIPGAYFSTSKDLITWSNPQRITYFPTQPREDNDNYFVSYPVLADVSSLSRNFDTLDSADIVLLYTVQHLNNGVGTMNRDLMYVPLKIE